MFLVVSFVLENFRDDVYSFVSPKMLWNVLTLCFINEGSSDVLLPVSQIRNKYGKGCDPPEKTQYGFMLCFLRTRNNLDLLLMSYQTSQMTLSPYISVFPLHPWPVTCHSQRTVHMRVCVLARMRMVR